MKKSLFIIGILAILISDVCISQPAPIRYGKIDTSQLKMKVYPKDPSAMAVVLCDYGNLDLNTFTFTRLLRLKVFSKEGSWFVNQLIYTPSKSTIKGCTYNFKDGKVVETKLREESIFREKVRLDYERFRVTMPDVLDGSIVELQYSFQGLPSQWYFQRVIPVEWSELRIPSSPYFSFNKIFFGFQPLSINTDGRWVGKDMPALHEEPYVSTINNYLTKVEIELANITFPGYYRDYATSWEDVNRFLLKDDEFGIQIKDFGLYLTEAVKNINDKCKNPKEKMIAAYDYVKEHVKWNEECSLYSTGNLSVAHKNNSGNSADVNMILIKLLKKLNLDVYPVALSTRDNGFIAPTFATIDNMNYVIAMVLINGERYLLDATESDLPPGLLPERCLNGNGRIVDQDKSDWIDLTPSRKGKKTIFADLQMADDNTIGGTLSQTLYDYEGLNFRKEYKKFTSDEEYIADIEAKWPGFVVNDIKIDNLDSLHMPINSLMNITLENQVDKLNDMLSFNPMLFFRLSESPFKSETRRYPVDYTYKRESRYVIKIKIPDGYVVSELPKPLSVVLPEKKGSFKYSVLASGNVLQLTATLTIDNTVFAEHEYVLLREFYKQIISKQSETVILKKAS